MQVIPNSRISSSTPPFSQLSSLFFFSFYFYNLRIYLVSWFGLLLAGLLVFEESGGAYYMMQPSDASGAEAQSEARTPSAESSSAPSALDQQKEELILANLKERIGDLGDGQRVSQVRQGVEDDLSILQYSSSRTYQIAGFINHFSEPNCNTKGISVEGQKKIFIYAKQ